MGAVFNHINLEDGRDLPEKGALIRWRYTDKEWIRHIANEEDHPLDSTWHLKCDLVQELKVLQYCT